MKKALILAVVVLMASVGVFANGLIGGFDWELTPGAALSLTVGYEGSCWAALVTKDNFSSWEGVYSIGAVYVPHYSDNSYGRFGVNLGFDWESGSMPVYQNLSLIAGSGYGIPIGGGLVTARGGLTLYISSSSIRPVINVDFLFEPPIGGVSGGGV